MSKSPALAVVGSQPGINDDIGEETRLALYRSQVVIRDTEQRAFDLFLQNLVKGTSPDQLATPADGLVMASDFETDLLGHLNSGFSKPAAGATYQGPFGYVVE